MREIAKSSRLMPMIHGRRHAPAAAMIVAILALTALPAAAQTAGPQPLRIPRLTEAPKIDGIFDNPAWEQALKIEDFVQLSPKENGTPSEKTTAWLGFDDKNLYVAFRCEDSQVSRVRCSVTNRDNCINDDWVVIFLDTFNEKRRAYSFILNPIGVQMDMIRTEEGGSDNMDASWDTVFLSEGTIDDRGWTVEAAIPFKSLRFPDEEEKTWNVVLGRNLPRTGEIILWPTYSRDIPGLIAQGRPFTISGHVDRGKNLEIMPFMTSLQREGGRLDAQPGANVKYGITSNSTVDVTLNPDFSHIEADAPQIDYNLRYALRYAEKRPFFLEGMEIFRSPEIETVYTRRIMDPIMGAKFSGKAGRFAYGILSAYDMNPSDSLWNIHDRGDQAGDNNALFNILRVKTDVGKGSYVGFALTDKEGTGFWNRVAGVDGQLRFKDRVFVSFQALASKTNYGGDRTALAPAMYGEATYQTKHWYAGGFMQAMHPEFEASAGFVNRVDYRVGGVFTGVTLWPDRKYLNQVNIGVRLGRRDGYFDSTTQDTWFRTQVNFRLTEFNRVSVEFENEMERFEAVDFRKKTLSIQGENQFIGWLPFYFFARTGHGINYDEGDAFLGYTNAYGVGATLKPSARLQLGFDVSKQTFWRKWGGERLWDYNVVRNRTTYQLSKSLSVRAIVDYNMFHDKVFGSFLFSYVLRPGTVFFLGVDTNYLQNDFGRYHRRDGSVFLKFSYWWRM